jgi:hypothetical protein
MDTLSDTSILLFDNSMEEEIKSAKEGSDIHGLIEKMAYHFHLNIPNASRESNWFEAQRDLVKWARFNYDFSPNNTAENIHDLLNTYAHSQYKQECNRRWTNRDETPYSNPTDFDSWMAGQDQLALQVLNQARAIW